MNFFKGILKYSVYIFIAVWMFLLGIMVGRGTSPVQFDTHEFQERLEIIADDFGAQKKKNPDKIDLKFYKILDGSENMKIVTPKKDTTNGDQKKILLTKKAKTNSIPLKTSKKKQTITNGKIKTEPINKPVKKLANTSKKLEKKPEQKQNSTDKAKADIKPKIFKGNYIVQIAAYKNLKDAASQKQVLKKKGFSSYSVKGQTDGITWYRVRSGPFTSFNEAKKFKKKLERVKISSLIIKSD